MKRSLLFALCAALAATVQAADVTLDWDANTEPDLGGYTVYYATFSLMSHTTAQANQAGSNVLKVSPSGTAATYVLDNLQEQTTYYIRLTASDFSGNQSAFNVSAGNVDEEVVHFTGVTPTPNAPSGLSAAAASSSQINLAWTDNANNETGFRIERRLGAGAFSEIAVVGANVTAYQNVSGLSAGTTYHYRVRAYISNKFSAYTAEASARTSNAPVVVSPTTIVTAPNAQGLVELANNGGFGRTRADFSLVSRREWPRSVRIDEENPTAAAPARGEATINAAINGGRPAMVYEFTADDKPSAVFNRPVRLHLAYRDADSNGIVDGTSINANQLKAFYHDGVEWRLAGGRRESDHTISVLTQHFSLYALFPAANGGAAGEALSKEAFLTPASLDGAGDTATFGLAARTVTIHDVSGREVARLEGDGVNAIAWTARDDDGKLVESGSYVAKVLTSTGETLYQTIVIAK